MSVKTEGNVENAQVRRSGLLFKKVLNIQDVSSKHSQRHLHNIPNHKHILSSVVSLKQDNWILQKQTTN
jgi:hypothetical protein